MRYSADYDGLRALMKGPEMQAVVREAAEKAMAYAVSISPEKTGEYKSSFEVTVTADGGVNPPGARAEAQLVNTSDHAVDVEWRDGYHVLARAAGALGTL